jgi:UDP-N-acetylglucosamine 2-epimerase (non-hydrolysing)
MVSKDQISRPLLLIGTRPECIKMAPVVWECRNRGDQIKPLVCLSGQHQQMCKPLVDYFDIRPDITLNAMEPGQTLTQLTARCLEHLGPVLTEYKPTCIIAQGDTTTVMSAALAAFYQQLPFVHVEAGLRTYDMNGPYPDEMNRRIISLCAAIHCAPTENAVSALLQENIPKKCVHQTGNTVVDTLLWTIKREQANQEKHQRRFPFISDRSMVLVTAHRRESLSQGLTDICQAVATLSERFSDVQFVYPVHLNPRVQTIARNALHGKPNVHLIEPVEYPAFIWLMNRSKLIMTDSGGIQEEAPSLGKPVLILRDRTERTEAVEAGAAEMVGTSVDRIIEATTRLLTDSQAYADRQVDHNPFGDGQAARRIVDLLPGLAKSSD